MIKLLPFAALVLTVCACGSEAASTSSSASAAASSAAKTMASGGAKPASKGEQAAAGGMVSCDNSKMGLCSEWRGLDKDETKEAKESCNDPGAVFGTAACKTDKLLGKCEHKDEKITIYMYPNEAVKDAKGAKEMCDDGVFTEAAK